jgi:NitT/TauT family transport system permease protein
LPYIFSALKISSALSVMGAVVAEMFGASNGLGYTILIASYNIDTPTLFAAIITASACGIIFFGLITLFEHAAAKRFMFVPRRDAS